MAISLPDFKSQMDADAAVLKEGAMFSNNRCGYVRGVAAADSAVQDKLHQKLVGQEHVLVTTKCHQHSRYLYLVIYVIKCKDGVFCLVPPTFAVSVNLFSDEIIVKDPFFYDPQPIRSVGRSDGNANCGCDNDGDGSDHDSGRASAPVTDDIGEFADLCRSAYDAVSCNSFLTSRNRCRSSSRCHEGFRKLRNVYQDPSRRTIGELNDWINASDMQERCMRAIIEYSDVADWAAFIAAIVVILA